MPGALYPFDERTVLFIPSLDLVMGGHISNGFPGHSSQATRVLLNVAQGMQPSGCTAQVSLPQRNRHARSAWFLSELLLTGISSPPSSKMILELPKQGKGKEAALDSCYRDLR